MKSLIALSLMSVCFGTSLFADEKIDTAAVQKIMSELRPMILPHVKTLSRPLYLFHWTNRSSVKAPLTGDVNPQDQLFLNYAKSTSGAFFKYYKTSRDMMGTGLYLAVDPVATRGYGAKGKTWVVLAMEAQKGARFIDVTPDVDKKPSMTIPKNSINQFNKDLTTHLASFGCPATSLENIFSMANQYTEQTGVKGASGQKCQALRVAIANDSQINASGVKYGYSATPFKTCGQRGYAFNVWSTSMFDPKFSYGFTAGVLKNDPNLDAKKVIRTLFDLSGQSEANSYSGEIPYPELKGTLKDKQIKAWIKKYLMGCDKGFQKEDNTSFKKTSYGY